MKTPLVIFVVTMCTGFGAFADSGNRDKINFTHTQKNPSKVCKEVKKSIKAISEEFKFIEQNYFFDHHFKQNTDLRKTGIYLFRNHNNSEEKKMKEKRV